jgi:murein endopeptidase
MPPCLWLIAVAGLLAEPPPASGEPPAAEPALAAPPAAGAGCVTDAVTPGADAEEGAAAAAGDQENEAGEGEIREPAGAATDDLSPRYSADLSDAELERRWVGDLPSLGSISVGFAEAGRLINAVQLPPGDAWEVLAAEYAWGAQETIDAIEAAARSVRERVPDAPPLRVNHISKRDGGWLRPHKSHQSGRDADLLFYGKGGAAWAAVAGKRTDSIDPVQNWALVRALVTRTDVFVILVDRRVIDLLYATALAAGEDRAWVDSIFRGNTPLVQHARGHRDHFHVRFFAPRSQELGRRVQPLLAKRPDENRIAVRIRSGDTLGHLALRYGSTVALIQNANGMRSSFLHVGRTLSIPLRGPCTRCPLPPPIVLPSRRLPPEPTAESAGVATASAAAPSDATPKPAAAAPPVEAEAGAGAGAAGRAP